MSRTAHTRTQTAQQAGAPSPNGDNGNGRDSRGRFTTGNSGGPGNPYAQQVGRLRTAMMEAVTEQDLREVVEKLVRLAKYGDVPSIRLLLDRLLGRPVEADLIERIERLEAALSGKADGTGDQTA